MTGDLHRDEVRRLLCVVSVFGGGVNRLWDTVRKTGSLDEVYYALFAEKASSVFTAEELRAAEKVHENQIEGIISYCESHNIGILCYGDRDYPQRLYNIFSPPALLFCKGDVSLLNRELTIAVVGARHISAYSERVTKAVAERIAPGGVVIASGFAVGTDITAHLSAVRSGGKTVAVLGCGIDHPYPEQNQKYKDEITENGLFISEYFPKTSANPINFIARNRILAGISAGVVVTEASDRSGSLNTASYALQQGKDIWAAPPADIFDKRYNGNKKLLYDGAIPLYSPDDILQEYFENYSHKPVHERAYDYVSLDGIEESGFNSPAEAEKKAPRKEYAEEKLFSPEPELSGLDKLVYDTLKKAGKPLSADDIADISGLDISDVYAVITGLEIDGTVSSESGQTYYIDR